MSHKLLSKLVNCIPSVRSTLIVLGWAAVGIFIGTLISALIWCTVHADHFTKAIRGEVEDAYGELLGLLNLGILVGGAIGLLNGWSKVVK